MLEIKIPMGPELWDEEKEEFVEPEYKTVKLEHSLVSIYKWESKWNKPFLSSMDKTPEQNLDYVRCMCMTQNTDPEIFTHLSKDNMDAITSYIQAPMTATTIAEDPLERNSRPEILTAEVIYYYMIALNIPFECQKWHLNQLLMLIKVCSEKNKPQKKLSMAELAARNKALNEERRRKMGSKG